jgi:hypothetical protein
LADAMLVSSTALGMVTSGLTDGISLDMSPYSSL